MKDDFIEEMEKSRENDIDVLMSDFQQRFTVMCYAFLGEVSEELRNKGQFIGTFDFYEKLDNNQKRIIDQELISKKTLLDWLYEDMNDNNFTESNDANVEIFFENGNWKQLKVNVILTRQGYGFSLRFSPHQ